MVNAKFFGDEIYGNRGEPTMRFETIPGEMNASIISSIINLVCPHCGGNMLDYQCGGRCGRNWLPEWEWAFKTTMRPDTGRAKGTAPKR